MLKIENLFVQFSGKVIYQHVDLFVGDQDKIGLVGKNGAGKSTLLKIIKGLQKPDEGNLILPKDCTIGYLPQEMTHNLGNTVRQEAATAFGESRKLHQRITDITKELGERTDYESEDYLKLAEQLNTVSERLGLLDSGREEEQISKILTGLGFAEAELDLPLSTFSGGWRMRVELAKILLQNPDLLLLDEPTNHLDIDSIEWLETFLKNYSGAIILISHDRTFLDNITNKTVEILNGRIHEFKAPYSKYVELRKEMIQRQIEEKKNQEKYIKHTQELINKFRAKKNKAAFAQSLIKKLEKLEIIVVDDEESSSIAFSFPPAPRSSKIVVEASHLSKRYGAKKVFTDLEFIIGRGEKLALIGQNGAGKTTLTKVIAGTENYTGHCELGANVDVGYFNQTQTEELDPEKTVLETIDEEATGDMRKNIRGILGAFLFQGDDVYKKIKVLSGGEKARLAMCKLLLYPYNFLILDEPTNHLDMRSKDVLKDALMRFDGALLVVSHDRSFLKGLTNRVLELRKGSMSIHHGDISDFLASRKAAEIREFENRKQANKATGSNSKSAANQKDNYQQKKISEKEKRQIQKTIARCESEIATLESKLAGAEKEMAVLSYEDPQKSAVFLEDYNALKEKLGQKMNEWEKLVAEYPDL